MRLLITTDTVGGVWTFTSELTQELLQRGHTLSLVSFGRLPSDQQEIWAREQQTHHADRFQFTASPAPLEWAQENERSFSEGCPVLVRAADQLQPDALLSSQFCFGAVPLPVPVVLVAHSDVLSWARACKVAALTPTPWLQRYRALLQDGLDGADALVAPTRPVLDDLSLHFHLPHRTEVIANGRKLPSSDATPVRKRQAITAGRLWDEAKGLEILEPADLPLPVLVAGETEFGEEFVLPVPPNVHLLGPLSQPALQQQFRESAIYLCTSHYEPFGLAPLEAALCGCAIIARDLPSLREVWGDDALYFRDAAGLATQVRRLLENDAARNSMAERASTRAATFSTARMADQYVALLSELRGLRNRRRADDTGAADVA